VNAAAQIGELRTYLPQLGLGFENIAVRFSSRKDGNVEAPNHLPGSVGMRRSDADVAVVCVQLDRRIVPGGRAAARKLRSPHLRLRRLIIRPRSVGALQVGLN